MQVILLFFILFMQIIFFSFTDVFAANREKDYINENKNKLVKFEIYRADLMLSKKNTSNKFEIIEKKLSSGKFYIDEGKDIIKVFLENKIFPKNSASLKVAIPDDYNVKIKAVDSLVAIKGISFENLEINVSSGSIKLKTVKLKKGVFKSDTGEINFMGIFQSGYAEFETISGNIYICPEEGSDVAINAESKKGLLIVKGKEEKGKFSNIIKKGRGKIKSHTISGDIILIY